MKTIQTTTLAADLTQLMAQWDKTMENIRTALPQATDEEVYQICNSALLSRQKRLRAFAA